MKYLSSSPSRGALHTGTVVASCDGASLAVEGVWPGWPLAIVMHFFTSSHLHPANRDLANRLDEMFYRSWDSETLFLFEQTLSDYNMIPYTARDSFECEISPREYFEMLQDECLRAMREATLNGGSIRYGPYVLRDGSFTMRDQHALSR